MVLQFHLLDRLHDTLLIISPLSLFHSSTTTVLGKSVGLSTGSGLAGCAQIRRAYVSSRAVFVRTDRDDMLRYILLCY